MTYLEIFAVRPDGNVQKYGEAHNAWGGAMHIWRTLDEKYQTGSGLFDYRPLWESIGRLDEPDQWVLASTYDWVLISKEHLPTLIKHLKAFCKRSPTETLDEAITVLERAVQDESVQAIGMNQTSVNDLWWHALTPSDEGADEDEHHPYNIHRETKHWYLTPEYIQSRRAKRT